MKRIVAILLSVSLVCLSPTITHAEEEQNNEAPEKADPEDDKMADEE